MNAVSPFAGFRNFGLDNFRLSDAAFETIFNAAVAENLPWLETLWLPRNSLGPASLGLIGAAANLQVLALSQNPGVTDLAPLIGLTKLNQLYLNGTGVADLEPLRTMYDAGCFHGQYAQVHCYGVFPDAAPNAGQQ